MSLDHDASDRTFDRQMAYLGLLDDAAPMFRDGSQVPSVGVLLALPYLVHSAVLRIARKLYGEIGPAFYGLRTTLLRRTKRRSTLLQEYGLIVREARMQWNARRYRIGGSRPRAETIQQIRRTSPATHHQ